MNCVKLSLHNLFRIILIISPLRNDEIKKQYLYTYIYLQKRDFILYFIAHNKASHFYYPTVFTSYYCCYLVVWVFSDNGEGDIGTGVYYFMILLMRQEHEIGCMRIWYNI